MERHNCSVVVTANDIGQKRHIFLDEEDTERGCKRVCVKPSRCPVGFDTSSDFSNPIPPQEANFGPIHPYFPFTETASELTNSLEVHSPVPFMVEPSLYDTAHLLRNGGEVLGTGHSAADVELTSLANMPFMYTDTGIAAQTLGPEPNTAVLMNMSQHNDNKDPLTPLNPQVYQIQQLNDLESSWGTGFYDLNTDFRVKSAASFGHQSDLSPIQYLPPIQGQAVGMTCFPTNAENSTLVAGIETGFSAEWPYMNNEVNLSESEPVTNVEMQSKLQSPATSESSVLSSNSGKPGRPFGASGVISLISNHLTVSDACDEVPDSESIVELSAVPKYDACFGVVS